RSEGGSEVDRRYLGREEHGGRRRNSYGSDVFAAGGGDEKKDKKGHENRGGSPGPNGNCNREYGRNRIDDRRDYGVTHVHGGYGFGEHAHGKSSDCKRARGFSSCWRMSRSEQREATEAGRSSDGGVTAGRDNGAGDGVGAGGYGADLNGLGSWRRQLHEEERRMELREQWQSD
ncbi:hypothetical protein Vafri_15652, partial [Volvox africanus]